MVQKQNANAAGQIPDQGLKKVCLHLEKLEQTLRRFGPDGSVCAALVRQTLEQLLEPPRVSREELERATLRKAAEEGRKYLSPEERAAVEDDPELEYRLALVNDSRTRDLPPRCREVVRLRFAEQRTPRQIARLLGVKVDTVKRDLEKAMKGFVHARRRAKTEGVVE